MLLMIWKPPLRTVAAVPGFAGESVLISMGELFGGAASVGTVSENARVMLLGSPSGVRLRGIIVCERGTRAGSRKIPSLVKDE